MVKPQEKAYRLRIEYETLDFEDTCPLFELRVISKPVEDIIHENLHCHAYPTPPPKLQIDSDDYNHEGSYAFPSDFLKKEVENNEPLEYDVVLSFANADPNTEYYLDIETESDFLASELSFSLLYEDAHKNLKPLGHSQHVPSSANNAKYV